VLPEALDQGFVGLLDRVYATGEPFIGNEVPVKIDRDETGAFDEVVLNFVYQPYRDDAGEIQGILVHAVDVTEQVRARQRIEELLKQKDEFIGVASHELKTPVTSVKAYAQALERRFRRQGDLRSADQLAKVDAQLNKLTNLIGDLLDATRLNANRLQFQEEWFDLDALIAEVVDELQHTTEQHVIRREGAAGATIWADRERVGQVLANFLSNAIKYSPQADEIIVRGASDGRSVTVAVQDFGVGIAEEERERVFERFYRAAGPKQETFPGLGLGLFVSAEIIRRQGGRIWVESELGRGSTFCFQLPIAGSSAPRA
jgi:signal transduction histidine kinase